MRRGLVLTSFCLPLVACASVLGDFDVAPSSSTNPDGGLVDGALVDGALATEGGGPGVDGGGNQPTAMQVATSLSATCATVKYPSGKIVSYCWGASGLNTPEILGALGGDANAGGFFRPRLPQATIAYVTFDALAGGATGDWFLGHGTTDVGAASVYAWGLNGNGQAALDKTGAQTTAPTATPPNALKVNGVLIQPGRLSAAPANGCVIDNSNPSQLYCWGYNNYCQVRSGKQVLCNDLGAQSTVRAVEDETAKTIGETSTYVIDQMAGGQNHTCVARHRASGSGGNPQDTVSCWGYNLFGQTGQAAATTFVDTPTDTSLSAKAGDYVLASGENHVCFLQVSAGKMTCWGRNDSGQAVPGATGASVAPTELNLPSDAGDLSLLTLGGDLSCVVAKNGSKPSHAYCFGAGAKGRAPVDAALPFAGVANIQDVTQLAIGRSHVCAVARSTGAAVGEAPAVWCWGGNGTLQSNPSGKTSDTYPQPIKVAFPPEPAN